MVDGCPPRITLSEADIQPFLDRRRPGQSAYTTQRQEADAVRILSGVFEGQTTGTPIALHIDNTDQRSRDYGTIARQYRPGHADLTYDLKYGVRDHRGGGRSSARETAMRVAAGAIARAVLAGRADTRRAGADGPAPRSTATAGTGDAVDTNPFFCPDPVAAAQWAIELAAVAAAPAGRWAPRSSWWPRACRPASARRSTPSWMRSWPAR